MDQFSSEEMNTYEILHDDFRNGGPFLLEDIRCLLESGEISPEQEVRRIGEEKTVSADYALIFYAEEAGEAESGAGDCLWKRLLGASMCVLGLVVVCLLIHAFVSDRSVSRQLVVVAVLLVLAGIKIYQLGCRPAN